MQTLNYHFPRAARWPAPCTSASSAPAISRSSSNRRTGTRHGAVVRVRTSVDGFDTVWHDVLERFFTRTPLAGRWELNDFGATPGVVKLRLRQAAEAAEDENR